MSPDRASVLVLGLVFAALVGCGATGSDTREPESVPAHEGAASASSTTNGSSVATEAAPSVMRSSVPECDAYLRLYQRCEPALAAEIASGDRRDFEHEAAWLEYLAGTPEVAGMPVACRDLMRELGSRCP